MTLLLSACGGATATVSPSSSTSAPPSPTPAPEPFAATGFRTNIPAGWDDQTTNQSAVASLNSSGAVLMLLTSPDHGLVVASTTPQPVADDQLAQYLTTVRPEGATGVTQPEPVDVDGDSGVLITFEVAPSTGTPQESEVMVVNQAGSTYEMVLSSAQADFSRDAAGLQEILDSWMWT